VACDPGWGEDLRDTNRRKNGAPFLHADGLAMVAALRPVPASVRRGRDGPQGPNMVMGVRARLAPYNRWAAGAAAQDGDWRGPSWRIGDLLRGGVVKQTVGQLSEM